MKTLVESLKRLYAKGRVTLAQLREMVKHDTITEAEYHYITGEDY